MIEQRTTVQSLPVRLSPEQENEQARKVAAIALELEDLEYEQKDKKAQMRAELKAVKERLADATATLRQRCIERPVEVKVFLDPDSCRTLHIRSDSGEVVKETSLSPEERERALKLQREPPLPPEDAESVEPETLAAELRERNPDGLWPSREELEKFSASSRSLISQWARNGADPPPSDIEKWVTSSRVLKGLRERDLQGSSEAILAWRDGQRSSVAAWLSVSSESEVKIPLPPILRDWIVDD